MGPQTWSWPPKEGEEAFSHPESRESPEIPNSKRGLACFCKRVENPRPPPDDLTTIKNAQCAWLHSSARSTLSLPSPGQCFICTSMDCPLSPMLLLPVHILTTCYTMNLPGPRSHLHIFLWFPRQPNKSWLTSRHLFLQRGSTVFLISENAPFYYTE